MRDNRAVIAEHYLTLIGRQGNPVNAGMYVRLAAQYGVPTGRIIALTGLAADVVIAHLEAKP